MPVSAIQQCLTTHQQWKTRVARAILELEQWLEKHRLSTPRVREQLAATLAVVRQDRLTVAFVSEVSRGKTELINALFFSDVGGRLLPSASGPATLCPTEILWDDQRNESYLRLLPIETRAQDIPIATLKADAKHWVHYPLNTQVAEQSTGTLRELLQTKTVSMAEATRLGLSSAGVNSDGQPAMEQVEIPKWRHAIISFPHPLLRQGLVVLDTPGVRAMESEQEFAVDMLPSVQAVVFVLAADAGVTRSDLEIWQHYLKGFQSTRQRAMLVALNKVDLLWGGQRDLASLERAITTQCRTVAEALGIDPESVCAVSAQKGLIGRIRKDQTLMRRSALPVLELQLATRMLETKHQIHVEMINATVGQLLDSNHALIAARISRVKAQLGELEALRATGESVIAALIAKTRTEQEHYLRGVAFFQESRELLLDQTAPSRQILEHDNIEAALERGRKNLLKCWTTMGLNRAMSALFEDLRRSMQTIASDSERVRAQVRDAYQVFRDEFAFDIPTPKVFVPMKYRVEIELLFQEVESLRRNPIMALSPRGLVIRHFQQQMVSRARVLFDQLRVAYDGWIRDTLHPLAGEISEHKAAMERRLENLQRITQTRDALQQRIDDMQEQNVGLARELTALRNIHNALNVDPLAEHEVPHRPRLVSSRANGAIDPSSGAGMTPSASLLPRSPLS